MSWGGVEWDELSEMVWLSWIVWEELCEMSCVIRGEKEGTQEKEAEEGGVKARNDDWPAPRVEAYKVISIGEIAKSDKSTVVPPPVNSWFIIPLSSSIYQP